MAGHTFCSGDVLCLQGDGGPGLLLYPAFCACHLVPPKKDPGEESLVPLDSPLLNPAGLSCCCIWLDSLRDGTAALDYTEPDDCSCDRVKYQCGRCPDSILSLCSAVHRLADRRDFNYCKTDKNRTKTVGGKDYD